MFFFQFHISSFRQKLEQFTLEKKSGLVKRIKYEGILQNECENKLKCKRKERKKLANLRIVSNNA